MSHLPSFEHFISVGNVKPKLSGLSSYTSSQKKFLLNCHPGVGPGQLDAPLPRPDGGDGRQGRVLLGGGEGSVLHGSHDCV